MMMHDGSHGGLWFMLIMGIVMVIPFWRICHRLGYPGVLSLLVLVPMVNLVFLYYLAFARWPVTDAAGQNRHSD